MKQKTESMVNELNREDYKKALIDLPSSVLEQWRSNAIPETDWVTLEEQIVRLNEIQKFIVDNTKIIDWLTFNQRNTIYSLLVQNIIPITIQIVNRQQAQSSLSSWSSYIETIYDLLFNWILSKNYWADVKNNITELQDTKAEYISAITQLQQIIKNKDVIDKFVSARDIIAVIEELKNQAQSKKSEIDVIWETVKLYESTYNQTSELFSKLEDKANTIVISIEDSQKTIWKQLQEVSELLKSATSSVASIEFQNRADKIWLFVWYIAILLTTIIWILTIVWAFWALPILWTNWIHFEANTNGVAQISNTALMILRIGLILPFIALDILFFRQLEFYKKLKEQYIFKAKVSWTLQNYVTILKTNEEWQWMKEYIMDLTKDILKSPLPDESSNLSKQWKEIVNKVFDKTIDFIDKKIP